MKKICLSFLLLTACSGAVFAQATLSGAQLNPLVNNSFTTVNCDTTGLIESAILGNTGPSYTWNFLGLSTISYDTAKEDTCATTPHCSLFMAGTNKASQTLSSGTYIYQILNSDSFAITGYYNSSTDNAIFTNPMISLKYPFTYLDSFNDAYAGSVTYNPGTGAITANEAGTVHVVCDGWGTLNLPGSVSDANVLRVRSSQTFIDSASIFGTPYTITVAISTFEWFMADYHSPLLSISFTDQIAGPGSLHTKTISYAKRYPLGVRNFTTIENSLELFPNPATDQLNIKFESTTSEKIQITVLDLLGREVAAIPTAGIQGVQQVSFNTGSVAKGLYLIRLQSGNETITRKVTVQ